MFTLEWKTKAVKQLKKVNRNDQSSIVVAVRALKQWPDCRNVKSLVNKNEYRLRVGRYRIIFDVESSIKIITIEEVKKRDERTY